ncbi:site-2 protease family protein [Zestomonas carbonaria]|uniref:Peptidase M50 domain-containing protein n=1 Tax=Zestomonas carbonaria TaxID=2762745 RepID=A0A7U7EIZ0_9GAMM|nr:site-2 protease family protein [Pseudomonas carbonaria]CAD5105840.1 hypothetical protein PSEWESI4_00097 [Pseudomonas carbonaria]
MEQAADLPTPPLRQDLRLDEVAPGASGEPAWVIQDTVTNRFYRIGWFELECLLRWGQSPRQICEQIAAQTALDPDVEQVLGFRQFLERHQLVQPDAAAVERMQASGEGRKWLSWRWWLHNYLFVRIPLVRPQRHLKRLARHLDWLFRPATGWLVILLGVLGIVLVLHQWDTFTHDVVESFSLEGLFSFALALIVAKALHELGHALVATRLGLRVAHMGVAFIVLWPMLYTDTGESWKLRSSRQRLAIASAGILTELALAGLATLGWALSEPSALRNALLYLATTSWVLSVALNASPFMRFDGYFILSDLLDFPNLHERSSALARVFLRRTLLGLDEDWPEPFPASRRAMLIGFAFATWLYRLVLFLGIAVAVYLLFFKLLGILLFCVEVAWFILLPVVRELKYWWGARARVRPGRRQAILGVFVVLLLLLALPWRSQITAFGVARAEQQLRLYTPYPALLQQVQAQGDVPAGTTLAIMDEPDIAARMRGTEAGIRGYQARLSGLLADPAGLGEQAVTARRLLVEFEQARAARTEMARLHLRAPFAGRWLDVNPEWQAGQWIGSQVLLGVLVDPQGWQIDAYVEQGQVHRLREGSPVSFYPEGGLQRLSGNVVAIGSTRVAQLEHAMLASRFGGPLGVTAQEKTLTPSPPLFHVRVRLDEPPPTLRETRGRLQIEGERRSLLGEGLTRLAAVVIRESGF